MLNLFNRTITDAWLVAFRLPNLFRRLLGEGSLSNSFIPVYVELDEISKSRARELVQSIYCLLLWSLCVCVSLGVIFSHEIVFFLVSGDGFLAVPGKLELTVKMARIMFLFLFAISHFAFFMAILNAHRKFAIPAIAPCLFNVAVICSALLPQFFSLPPAITLSWGVVVGGIFQACFLLPSVFKLGISLRPKLIWNADVKKVLTNMAPGMVGMGTIQFMALVNTALTSHFGEGSHTWIYTADRILEFPLSLIAVSIGSALLPSLAKSWAQKNKQEFGMTIAESVGLNIYLAVPAAMGMYFLADSIISLLFAWRSQVSLLDIKSTSEILKAYSFLLIFASLIRIVGPCYYALKNTWFPAAAAVGALIQHVILAPMLMAEFGLVGLIYSVILSSVTNLTVLLVYFHRVYHAWPFAQIAQNMRNMLPGFVVIFILLNVVSSLGLDQQSKIITLALIVGIIVIYLVIGTISRVEYASRVLNKILRR